MKLNINTTQNVNINYALAGVGPRILATLIDLCVISASGLVLSTMAGIVSVLTENYLFLVLFYLLISSYHFICEYFFHGKSIGKMSMNLQVVRLDGKTPRFWDYLLRWVFRLIDISISMGGIAIISIITTKHMQRLGDLAAGTTVVKTKKQVRLQQLSPSTSEEDYQVTYPQVIALSDNDIKIIKEVLQEVEDNMQYGLLAPLVGKITEITGIVPLENNYQFIKKVLADYLYITSK